MTLHQLLIAAALTGSTAATPGYAQPATTLAVTPPASAAAPDKPNPSVGNAARQV